MRRKGAPEASRNEYIKHKQKAHNKLMQRLSGIHMKERKQRAAQQRRTPQARFGKSVAQRASENQLLAKSGHNASHDNQQDDVPRSAGYRYGDGDFKAHPFKPIYDKVL